MTAATGNVAPAKEWPSIDTAKPLEEGGPIARTGFNYQDEIAVGFLIEMLANPALLKVHLETHDDIVLVWAEGEMRKAEFVQVKATQLDKYWSVAELCQRKGSIVGTSIFEKSLNRDAHEEQSFFRIVTLRPVVTALQPLTLSRDSELRDMTCEAVVQLVDDIEKRCPSAKSPKGGDPAFWVKNCVWDHRESEAAIEKDNLIKIMHLAFAEGRPILLEPAQTLLLDLRAKAKAAGAAKWYADPSKKIITRQELRAWWDARIDQLISGAATPSGGKLITKMKEAGLAVDMLPIATELRREYSAEIRASRYLEPDDAGALQRRVLSEVTTLRARFVSNELNLNPAQFHSLCITRMDAIDAELAPSKGARAAFLKGCLYDIADRCLLRFTRAEQ